MRRYLNLLLTLLIFALFASPLARADQFPPGLYRNNTQPIPWGGGCQPLKMDHGTLSAVCLNYFGAEQNASLTDADKCTDATHAIWDVNGFLRCVDVSLVERIGGSNPYTAHIISISSDVKTDKDETKVIRIDQPRVDVPSEDYPSITFTPAIPSYSAPEAVCSRAEWGLPGKATSPRKVAAPKLIILERLWCVG
jgi:hypothetical protein